MRVYAHAQRRTPEQWGWTLAGKLGIHLHDNSRKPFFALHDHMMADPLLREASGATHTHHTEPGGYLEYVAACIVLAERMYPVLSGISQGGLPFTLPAVVRVLYLHNVDRPWRHAARVIRAQAEKDGVEPVLTIEHRYATGTDVIREMCRRNIMELFGITLSDYEREALRFAYGEGEHYTPERRTMNELAAFCNGVIVAGTRIFHGEPWRALGR